MKKFTLVPAFLLLALSAFSQEPALTPAIRKAMDAVDTSVLRSHIAYLADDILRGRKPGTPGYQMAVDYVIKEYKRLGLRPAGENGTYIQKFTLRKADIVPSSVKVNLLDDAGNADSLIFKNETLVFANPIKPSVDLSSVPLVFAGFGMDVPGKYSDYENIDVKGKIVVVLRRTPDGYSSTYDALFSSLDYKSALAFSKGAVGLISASIVPGALPAQPVAPSVTASLNPEKTKAYSTRFTGNVDAYVSVSLNVLRALFLNSGKNLNEVLAALKLGRPQSFDLGKKMSIQFKSTYLDVETYNVIGLLPGADKKLKEEYIVHSAHLDHVGVMAAVDGDSIYNGAHDNASGVSSSLGIAELYRTAKIRPRRSVLFLMVSAEELGLTGAGYFAAHPTVPAGSIVANINTDMPTPIAPLLSIAPLGSQYSSILKHIEYATKILKIDIEEDPEPEQGFFMRSDQYNFVKKGIPAVYFVNGRKTNTPGFDFDAYLKQWRAKYYHKPADQIDGIFDFKALKTFVQLNFLVSYSLANDQEKPKWNEGELF
jgi:hypothetical protein